MNTQLDKVTSETTPQNQEQRENKKEINHNTTKTAQGGNKKLHRVA
jgi:hypothetical protein